LRTQVQLELFSKDIDLIPTFKRGLLEEEERGKEDLRGERDSSKPSGSRRAFRVTPAIRNSPHNPHHLHPNFFFSLKVSLFFLQVYLLLTFDLNLSP